LRKREVDVFKKEEKKEREKERKKERKRSRSIQERGKERKKERDRKRGSHIGWRRVPYIYRSFSAKEPCN